MLVPTSTPVNTLVIRLLSPLAELKQLDKPHLDKPISGLSISRTHLLEGCESQKQLLWVGHLRLRGNKRAAPEDSRYPLLPTLAAAEKNPAAQLHDCLINAPTNRPHYGTFGRSVLSTVCVSQSVRRGSLRARSSANADSSLLNIGITGGDETVCAYSGFRERSAKARGRFHFRWFSVGPIGCLCLRIFPVSCGVASCSPRDGRNLTATATATASKSAPAEASTEVL